MVQLCRTRNWLVYISRYPTVLWFWKHLPFLIVKFSSFDEKQFRVRENGHSVLCSYWSAPDSISSPLAEVWVTTFVAACLNDLTDYWPTLKMEIACSSETSVFAYKATCSLNPQVLNVNYHRREDLKTYIIINIILQAHWHTLCICLSVSFANYSTFYTDKYALLKHLSKRTGLLF